MEFTPKRRNYRDAQKGSYDLYKPAEMAKTKMPAKIYSTMPIKTDGRKKLPSMMVLNQQIAKSTQRAPVGHLIAGLNATEVGKSTAVGHFSNGYHIRRTL